VTDYSLIVEEMQLLNHVYLSLPELSNSQAESSLCLMLKAIIEHHGHL